MNYSDRGLSAVAQMKPLDVLLADVAVRVQLSPSDYQLAVDRYHTIHEWIESEESPLYGMVEDFYPQGGFSIGATVARHATDAEFDIDVIAQLSFGVDVDAEVALATLDKAIRRDKGSRYYDMTDRKTRCSTVTYAGMHLDVTPTVRLAGTDEKTGIIFHSKPSDPNVPKQKPWANPFGFADWFKARTTADQDFGMFFEKRSLDYDRERFLLVEKADAAPVPEQLPAYRKSRAVIALQLIKRWRNLAYDGRHPDLRMPPSVLLAYWVALSANQTATLGDELIHQVDTMIARLEGATGRNELVSASNPKCDRDEFTDRWPSDQRDQSIFIAELRGLSAKLHGIRDKEVELGEMQKVLEELFGEKPAQSAIRDYVSKVAKDASTGGSRFVPGRAAIPAGIAGVATTPAAARTAPPHKFFGDSETR